MSTSIDPAGQPSPDSFSPLVQAALRVAEEAGELLSRHAAMPRDIRHKGRIDLVTATDLAVEEFLRRELARILPGSRFLAEESSPGETIEENTWIIDPVDGTTNYAHGLPFVGISIGLWQAGDVSLGIVQAPLMGESFVAVKGQGAYRNNARLRISSTPDLVRSLVATGFPYAIEEELPGLTRRLARVLSITQGVRRFGAASLDLAYVAAGRFDAFYERRLNPWDVAAGWLLVREAGGMVTRTEGAPYHLHSHDILATNGVLHPAMLKLMDPADYPD